VVDKVLVLQDGAIAAYGSAEDIMKQMQMMKTPTPNTNK
jgi:ABC-type protease/lipase transport system fused ATPase/permease subunit